MSLFHLKFRHFCKAASALGPEVSASARRSVESRVSVPHSPAGLLDTSLFGFHSWMFWGPISRVQVLKVGVPNVE